LETTMNSTPDSAPDSAPEASIDTVTDPPIDGDDNPAFDDDEPTSAAAGESWAHRNLTALLAAGGVLLVGSLVLSLFLLNRLNQTEDELNATQADLERVEAGAALFASQVNGFVETIDELGPSIDTGLDEAVVGLEEFGTSTIEFTVNIDENISISENFELKRTVEVPIKTSIPINETIDTTVTVAGPFGVDIPIDIEVPVDLDVPIDLTVDVPIDESIPIDVDVPIQLDVPIEIDVEGTELQTLTDSLVAGLTAFQESLGSLTGN